MALLRGETLCEVNLSVKRANVFLSERHGPGSETQSRRSDHLKPAIAADLILSPFSYSESIRRNSLSCRP